MVGFDLRRSKCFIFQWRLTDTLSASLIFVQPGDSGNRLPASLGVRHDFSGTTPAIVASFDGEPSIPFTIAGVARPATRLLAGAEASWAFTAATSLSASYEGAFAPDYTQHRLQAAIRTAF